MDPNTCSTEHPGGHAAGRSAGQSAGRPDGLATLAAAVDQLATQDPTGLPDAVAAEQLLELRRLVDRLEGHWLKALAAVDGLLDPRPARPSRRPWTR